MGLRRVALLALFVVCEAALAQMDQLPKQYQDFVSKNNITSPDTGPWHLKASFQQFNALNSVVETAVVEEWWHDPHSWRLSVQVAGTNTVFVHKDDKTYSNVADATLPSSVRFLLPQIIEPAPRVIFLNPSPELHQRKFGKDTMDCVTQTRGNDAPAYEHNPMPYHNDLCFADHQALRVVQYDGGALSFLHNKMASFRGKFVAEDVVMDDRQQHEIFHAEVQDLRTIPESDVDLSSDGLILDTVLCPFFVDGPFRWPKVLSKAQLNYPELAKMRRVGGTVYLSVLIGKDGKVSSVNVVSSPDEALSAAAVATVKRWLFETTQVDGHDVGFDQVVEVRFNLTEI